uniref:Uncharacterized protein n=1 Tax=Anguilla anguilla TaxID=7936 RepID=A0A0E9RUK3_ANGAN
MPDKLLQCRFELFDIDMNHTHS